MRWIEPLRPAPASRFRAPRAITRRLGALTLLSIACLACGSATANAPSAVSAETTPPETGDAPTAEDTEASRQAEPAAEATDSPPATPDDPPPEDESPREVVYRSSPEGLVIEVEGLTLTPKVEPIRFKGGWAAKVTVIATTSDSMFQVLSPENGPLMFAAQVERKGKTETVPDTRSGSDEVFVTAGDESSFSRQFPGKKAAPLWHGHSIRLYVGMWGVGKEGERRRPIRKLFNVRMVVGNGRPQPVITPPDA